MNSRMILTWIIMVMTIGISSYLYLIKVSTPDLPMVMSRESVNVNKPLVADTDSGLETMRGSDLETSKVEPDSSVLPIEDTQSGLTSIESIEPKAAKQDKRIMPLNDTHTSEVLKTGSTEPTVDERAVRRAKLKEISAGLAKIIGQDPASRDLNEVDALFAQMQAMGDAQGVFHGVSIPQLRKIVQQSGRISQTAQGVGLQPGETRSEKLKQELEGLQGLQQTVLVPTP